MNVFKGKDIHTLGDLQQLDSIVRLKEPEEPLHISHHAPIGTITEMSVITSPCQDNFLQPRHCVHFRHLLVIINFLLFCNMAEFS